MQPRDPRSEVDSGLHPSGATVEPCGEAEKEERMAMLEYVEGPQRLHTIQRQRCCWLVQEMSGEMHREGVAGSSS